MKGGINMAISFRGIGGRLRKQNYRAMMDGTTLRSLAAETWPSTFAR